MAPVVILPDSSCDDPYNITAGFNITAMDGRNGSAGHQSNAIGASDLHALLYIVVTLLFYSLGIIIGIVTYLKREKAEIEEDKIFDDFLQMQQDPFSQFRYQKVQEVVVKLAEMEEKRRQLQEQSKQSQVHLKVQNDDVSPRGSKKGHSPIFMHRDKGGQKSPRLSLYSVNHPFHDEPDPTPQSPGSHLNTEISRDGRDDKNKQSPPMSKHFKNTGDSRKLDKSPKAHWSVSPEVVVVNDKTDDGMASVMPAHSGNSHSDESHETERQSLLQSYTTDELQTSEGSNPHNDINELQKSPKHMKACVVTNI